MTPPRRRPPQSPSDRQAPSAPADPAVPTVFVIDDDAAIRHSVSWLLRSVGLRVETYASGEEFLAAYDPARPGCLLLDIRMPEMSGASLQEQLVARTVHLPIIVMTGYASVASAVRTLQGGAIDYIEKPVSDQLLLDRVHYALDLDRRDRLTRSEHEQVARRLAALTPRERQVLDAVVAGHSNKAIATQLSLSAKTIEVHRAHVMKKMEANSLAELIRIMIDAGAA